MIVNDGFVRTLAAIKGGPVTVLLLLARIGTQATAPEVAAALGISTPSARAYLATLEAHGMAARIGTDWQIASAGRQMVIGESIAMSDIVGELAPANTQPIDAGSAEKKNIFSPPIIINDIKDSKSINSNNNNSGGEKIFHSQSNRGRQPQPSPFSAADEVAIGALCKVGVPRRQAEKAVSKSPLSSEIIAAQALAWVRYRNSERGANLRTGRGLSQFPFLVARRIEDGDLCPESDNGEAYSGYSGYSEAEAD